MGRRVASLVAVALVTHRTVEEPVLDPILELTRLCPLVCLVPGPAFSGNERSDAERCGAMRSDAEREEKRREMDLEQLT